MHHASGTRARTACMEDMAGFYVKEVHKNVVVPGVTSKLWEMADMVKVLEDWEQSK